MKLVGCMIAVCLTVLTSNGLAQDHTVSVDNKVIMFFAKMDEIVKNEDIIGLREGYAPNAVVTFREKTGRGIQEDKFTKDIFVQLMAKNFTMANSHSISREIVSISSDAASHRVTVSCTEVENITTSKKIIVTNTKNKYVLMPAKGSYVIIERESELLDQKTSPSSN